MYHRETLGSLIVEILLVCTLISLFLLVKAVVFVVTTFIRYHQHKALWIALTIFGILSGIGALLGVLVAQQWFALIDSGAAVLLITCAVINIRNRDTFMRENINLMDEVLHSSWWGSEDEPIAA